MNTGTVSIEEYERYWLKANKNKNKGAHEKKCNSSPIHDIYDISVNTISGHPLVNSIRNEDDLTGINASLNSYPKGSRLDRVSVASSFGSNPVLSDIKWSSAVPSFDDLITMGKCRNKMMLNGPNNCINSSSAVNFKQVFTDYTDSSFDSGYDDSLQVNTFNCSNPLNSTQIGASSHMINYKECPNLEFKEEKESLNNNIPRRIKTPKNTIVKHNNTDKSIYGTDRVTYGTNRTTYNTDEKDEISRNVINSKDYYFNFENIKRDFLINYYK